VVLFFWLILGYASCFLVQFEPDHPVERVKLLKWSVRKTLI
jgi:hypothetical protein